LANDPLVLLDQLGVEIYGGDWWDIKSRFLAWMATHPERFAAYGQAFDEIMRGWLQ
jgi:hypothetical protein